MIKLPSLHEPIPLADWIEASLLIRANKTARISDTEVLKALDSADVGDADSLFDNALSQIQYRSRVLGPRYPFVRNGKGLLGLSTWDECLPYSFMLLISLNQAYAELNFAGGLGNRPAELFEYLTVEAISGYLGCSAVRFGARRRLPVPARFDRAIEYLADSIGEIRGKGDVESQIAGDNGLDVLGWATFQDKRPSQLIILIQCAIGTDWPDKRSELDSDLWRRHIDFHSTPVRAYAVPFHHDSGDTWRETSTRAGIVFDRLRITNCLRGRTLPRPVRQGINKWTINRGRAVERLII